MNNKDSNNGNLGKKKSSGSSLGLKMFSWKTFKSSDELIRRILFTLGVLVIYRIGTFIPVPGFNASVISEYVAKSAGGFLAMFDTFSGGSLSRTTIMFLNLMPYISASIIMQILSSTLPALQALKKEGESGQQKKNQYTRYLALLLASLQAYGIATGLESVFSEGGLPAVMSPGYLFRFTTVVSLVGGTFFLMWLGEQLSSRGLGQGSSMIIYAGIIANLPSTIYKIVGMVQSKAVSLGFVMFDLALIVVLLGFIVFMEKAYRRVPVQYPKGQLHMIGGMKIPDEMPIKLNVVGVMAPIFASSLMSFPTLLSYVIPGMSAVMNWLGGNTVYFIFFSILLVFFSFFLGPIVLNPEETAEMLRKNGGFIPGYRPGEATVKFFTDLLNRLAVIGAIYLLLVCVLPDIFIKKNGLNVYFGGTSLLIMVGVTHELISQIYGYILSFQYENLFNKFKRGMGKGAQNMGQQLRMNK